MKTLLLPLIFIPCVTGCFGHITPAEATMAGIEAPVLLGPVDHVGGGAPLKVEELRDFEATSRHLASHSESGGYSTDIRIVELDMRQEAEYATRGDSRKEIRLTEVKPQADGVLVSVKARVDVEGQVVRVSGGKAAR